MGKHWLVRSENIRLLWRIFIGVLAATVAAELFVSHEPKFGIDGYFAFNAWYGLIACAALIFLAKALGAFLKRPDDYYQESDD